MNSQQRGYFRWMRVRWDSFDGAIAKHNLIGFVTIVPILVDLGTRDTPGRKVTLHDFPVSPAQVTNVILARQTGVKVLATFSSKIIFLGYSHEKGIALTVIERQSWEPAYRIFGSVSIVPMIDSPMLHDNNILSARYKEIAETLQKRANLTRRVWITRYAVCGNVSESRRHDVLLLRSLALDFIPMDVSSCLVPQ